MEFYIILNVISKMTLTVSLETFENKYKILSSYFFPNLKFRNFQKK